jgi:xanthine dehydrogenase accessory factor
MTINLDRSLKMADAAATKSKHAPLPFTENVLSYLKAWRAEGLQTILVTLIGINGSSPRPLGSQMAVAEDGRSVGIITGGCAQSAIIHEALSAMEAGKSRIVRLGEGSPYLDIKLPCGSGLDIHFSLSLHDDELHEVLAAQTARQAVELGIPFDETPAQVCEVSGQRPSSNRTPTGLNRVYLPKRRIVVAGKGPIVASLSRLGSEAGFEVIALSPEEETRALSMAPGVQARDLQMPEDFPGDLLDQWTALAVLFHDHDWEPPILAKALASPCTYIGALGSRQTHAQRLETLTALGLAEEDLARIHGPIGLDTGAKSPPGIAISILAQIQSHLDECL